MKTVHKLPKLTLEREESDTSSLILSNKAGSFLFLSEKPLSKFNGFFCNDSLELYKVIENISLVDTRADTIENHLTHITRRHDGNSETIEMKEGVNGFAYLLSKKAKIVIDFDTRKACDMRSFGRYYDVIVEKDTIIMKFTKRTDQNEDNTHLVDEFSLYIAIIAKGFSPEKDFEPMHIWTENKYPYDEERKDFPASRYIYRPFMLNAKELRIGVGKTKEEAITEADKLKKKWLTRQSAKEYRTIDKKKNPESAAAFICAQDSLDKLKVVHEGITRLYAGYPWFFQLWSRDECISLGALIKLRQFGIVKDIIFNYLKNVGVDGRLPNLVPSPQLGSADSIGWFWKRVGEYIEELKSQGEIEKHLSSIEIDIIKGSLENSIRMVEQSYKHDELITNKAKETWMDTDFMGQDTREGACIEIQALHLNMLKLAHTLTKDKKYEHSERRMKKKVVDSFWNGLVLADRAGDYTIRPNIFIAYYAYPDLLSRREWQTCFETALERLWLDWGGLASIDKSHSLFKPDYTGKDNVSYHRGDSWYWINNLAALCMFRNNPIAFEDKILKVIEASSREILWHGAIGHHAEISSSSHLSSKGCFAQAWSDAMFIELIMESSA